MNLIEINFEMNLCVLCTIGLFFSRLWCLRSLHNFNTTAATVSNLLNWLNYCEIS